MMNRTLLSGAAGAVLSILAAGSAFAGDNSQLAGSARIAAADAETMTLDEIAARKFSREGRDNVQAYAPTATAGFAAATAVRSSRTVRTESLDAFHAGLVNRSVSGDERQTVPSREAVASNPDARGQLVASAALDADSAAGMSLDAIAAYKFNREADGDDRSPIAE